MTKTSKVAKIENGDGPPTPFGGTMSPRRDAAIIKGMALVLCFLFVVVFFQARSVSAQDDPFLSSRISMVEEQVRRRGVKAPAVLDAMKEVPRHLFVPADEKVRAYGDFPVGIAPGQTLSQAYVSAQMISLLELDGSEKVLEVGTGSGYDAAVLSRLAQAVVTVEIDPLLAEKARRTLAELGYENVQVKVGDGFHGWSEEAPFDAILMTTAPQVFPEGLLEQLRTGGRMVLAVGGSVLQDLKVITKTDYGRQTRKVSLVNLVPMEGDINHQDGREDG